MSLIHWWPLNGDLQDKIQGKVLSTSTWTSSTGGKIGSCYNMNIGGTATCSNIYLPSTFTMTCWIKNNDLAYPQSPCAMKLSNGSPYKTTTADKGWEFCHGGTLSFTTNDGTAPKAKFLDYNPSSLVGTWYHLALVSDFINKVAYIYINGSLVKSATITSGDWGGTYTFTVGQLYGWKIDGLMNDLRLYDHALSQAEVKELSKALVIHYTFDDILAEPTTNLVTQGALSWSKLTVNVSSSHSNGVYTITTTTANNDAASGQIRANFPLAILTTGATYYFSCKYKVISGAGAFSFSDWCDSSLSDKKTKDCGDFYELSAKCYTTRTYNSTYRFLDCNISANSVIEVWDVQLQTNDKVTPYVLGTRESMIRNEAETIQPSTVSNVILTTDSASGSYSLKCAGSTYLNHSPLGDTSTGATASMWIKNMDVTGQIVAFADANSQLAFGPYGSYCCIGCVNGTNKRRALNVSSLWKADEWNHVVVKKDSSNTYYCYINGVETTYGNTDYWTHSTYLTIGARYSSGYSRQFTGLIDDFRLYHTCLTAEEIQDLYKARALITDKGDIETHQFIEGKTQAQVTSKYCFEADEFYEDFEVGSDYERIEYIEFSETQYIDTGLAFTDASIPIIIEADIIKTRLSGNDCLAGCGNGAWSGPVMLNCHNGTCEFGVNGYATASDGSGSITANERLIIRAELGTKKEEHFWYKNGQKINLGTKAYNDRTSSSSTLYIGAFHVGTSVSIASGSCWIGRLYSFKVWYGGSSRILVPAKRKSDSAFGLYDMAEHNFYSNIGGGSLSGGPIINSSEAKIYQDQHILGRNIIEI